MGKNRNPNFVGINLKSRRVKPTEELLLVEVDKYTFRSTFEEQIDYLKYIKQIY